MYSVVWRQRPESFIATLLSWGKPTRRRSRLIEVTGLGAPPLDELMWSSRSVRQGAVPLAVLGDIWDARQGHSTWPNQHQLLTCATPGSRTSSPPNVAFTFLCYMPRFLTWGPFYWSEDNLYVLKILKEMLQRGCCQSILSVHESFCTGFLLFV